MVETNIFDRLLDSVVFIEHKSQGNCNLLLCGDFNSRTSDYPDFVVDDGTMHVSVLPQIYRCLAPLRTRDMLTIMVYYCLIFASRQASEL